MATVTRYALSTLKLETTSNKPIMQNVVIDVDTRDGQGEGNVLKNVDVGCFRTYDTADVGKAFVIQSGGAVGLQLLATQFEQVDALPETGTVGTLYYLKADWTTYKRGLYVYNGSAYAQAERDAGTAVVECDNVTISQEGGQVHVLDGNEGGTTGITVAKLNVNAVSKSVPATASAVDTKLTTEKAVATSLDSKLSKSTTGKTIVGIGVSAEGVPFIEYEE